MGEPNKDNAVDNLINNTVDNNPDFIEMPGNEDDLPIKKIRELRPGFFIEVGIPFKPIRKIQMPVWDPDFDTTDSEEVAAYIKKEIDEIPTYPAYSVYKVIEVKHDTISVSVAPLFAGSDVMDKSFFNHIIILPMRRVGRADFRSRGYFYGHTKSIGDYASEDLDPHLKNLNHLYHDGPLRHKAMAQVDMIMADVERIFNVRALPAQLFQISLKIKDRPDGVGMHVLGTIYYNFILSIIRRLMLPQVMVNMNELFRAYRIQPDPLDPEEDELLVTIAVDFTLKEDYYYIGVEGFEWPI